jgi:hypothetical protein
MAVKLTEMHSDDSIISELLPYVHPHEGVLRCQLQRKEQKEKENLQWMFSFVCSKCDHQASRGCEVLVSTPSLLEEVLDKVAYQLREFCEDTQRVPCLNLSTLAFYSQRVTEMLAMHGTLSEAEFEACWATWFPKFPFGNAKRVAEHLGFRVDDSFQLPRTHPWVLNPKGLEDSIEE